jgi:hypothetical protein
MDISLEKTEACLENIKTNQKKMEIKMKAYVEEMKVEILGGWRTDMGTDVWP